VKRTISEIAQTIVHDKVQGRRFPTDLLRLTQDEDLELVTLDSSRAFDGRFELCHGKPTIFLNLHGRGLDDSRVRFTLGHELGHFFLHRSLLRQGGAFHDDKITFGEHLKTVEREANTFSAECILPKGLLRDRLDGRVLDIRLVDRIASEAKASLQATAIRLASATSDRLCFFWEEDGAIQWPSPSDDWKHSMYRWSAWTGAIPPKSAAASCSDSFEEREVARNVWCPNSPERDEPLYESSLRTSYGRLILVVDAQTADDES